MKMIHCNGTDFMKMERVRTGIKKGVPLYSNLC